MVPGPRVELGTPASSGQRSTDELARHMKIVSLVGDKGFEPLAFSV